MRLSRCQSLPRLFLPLDLAINIILAAAFFFVAGTTRLVAQPGATIAEAEALLPPTPARIAAIHQAAQQQGWGAQRDALQAAALLAYEKDKLSAAEAWYHLLHWAVLFGLKESEFSPAWARRVSEARVAHANLPSFVLTNRALGSMLSLELQAWVLSDAAFSSKFFALLSPLDYVPGVFQALDESYRSDPARFKSYPDLALAIAVVYDVPPPPYWPHAQVSERALPRRLPKAAEAFAWWVQEDRNGHTFHKFNRLSAEELKFVVDAAAPYADLQWAGHNVNLSLARLPEAYSMIKYSTARAAANQALWPGATYRLADILAVGGICADQAYFATQVGKARGVPTLLFRGAGNDARHGWFGYLDASRKWRLDAGRYAEQRFTTGYALDPQTWGELTDHDINFLTESFRAQTPYRQSRIHAAFASEYLGAGRAAQALSAARKAVSFERRNREAWEVLAAATQAQGGDARAVEAVWREAALAFQKYPDLEAAYVNRVAASLRARGQSSAAEAEIRQIARKNEASRTDLAVQQARNLLINAIAIQPLPERIRIYNQLVDTAGQGAGIQFFDQVVTVFAEHLLQVQQPAEATRALERAQGALKIEPRSQLETEFAALAQTVKKGAK